MPRPVADEGHDFWWIWLKIMWSLNIQLIYNIYINIKINKLMSIA